jgi:hypothetical protein
MENSHLIITYLKDYARMLQVGLSLKYPLEADRARVLDDLDHILYDLAPGEDFTSGNTRADTRRLDTPTRLPHEAGDTERGDRGIYRGYSQPGANPADRSDEIERREIPPTLGREEDPRSQNDGAHDDSSPGASGG